MQQDETDPVDFNRLQEQLTKAAPEGLEVFKVAEPVNKTGKIAAAAFCIELHDPAVFQPLTEFLAQPEILTEKKTKKGAVKPLNLAPLLLSYSLSQNGGSTVLNLKLPAGGENNINPTLLLKAFSAQTGFNPSHTVCRTMLYLANGTEFI